MLSAGSSIVPWRFFALAYAISWCLWGLALLHVFAGLSIPAVELVTYAGAFGPCGAALVCAGRPARRQLLRGMLASRQSWVKYLMALLLMPGSMLAARVLSRRPLISPGSPPIQPVVVG